MVLKVRIAIDVQGFQSESRCRGIGRYSLSIVRALLNVNQGCEITLVVNGMLSESVQEIRDEFSQCVGVENIRVWYFVPPIRRIDPSNRLRNRLAGQFYEEFVLNLEIDALIVTSFFEYGIKMSTYKVSFWKKIATSKK